MSAGAVLIVGAGPCGLGCARELSHLGHRSFEVIERETHAGGLASSVIDAAGFTWDRGGHVVFSHYGEFDRLLLDIMGDDLVEHDRSSFVRSGDRWVPYPYQNNLHRLDPELVEEAIVGLIDADRTADPSIDSGPSEVDFASWMTERFGPGICRQFMQPYNDKVWAHPLSTMSSAWIAERVATIDWRASLRAIIERRDDVAWGPNDRFAFPTTGGTGEIYRRTAAGLSEHISYGTGVSTVDARRRVVVMADGTEREYDHMVWTGALDVLVECLVDAPDTVRIAATRLVHNSVTIVGIGYSAALTDDRSWLYFPDPDVPFYRATNFAKYAAANVPDGRTDLYCSWMTEIASSPHRPLASDDPTELGQHVDAALRSADLVGDDAEAVSIHVDHIDRAYPVPTLGRDDALAAIQPWLMEHDIYARGRFGAWRYELGNMDHAVKMGVDIARHLVDGAPEQAWST